MKKHIHADLGFWCEHCNAVRHASEYDYETTDEHYVYTLHCPGCHRKLVLKQKSVMAYIREQTAHARRS